MLSFLQTLTSQASSKNLHHFSSLTLVCFSSQALTSVSRKRRRALFFLMFFRRTDTAIVSTKITTMKRPPITPAAIRGVLKTRKLKEKLRKWLHNKDITCRCREDEKDDTLPCACKTYKQIKNNKKMSPQYLLMWVILCYLLTNIPTWPLINPRSKRWK